MANQNSINNDPFDRLTSAEIDALSPVEGKPYYDTDKKSFRSYNPSNPSPGAEKYEEFGVNNSGVVKVNGYFSPPISCTFDFTTNNVNATGHPMLVNDSVSFKDGTGSLPPEINEDQVYYVVAIAVNTFQISETLAGPVLNFTTNGAAGTVFYDLSAAASKQSIVLAAMGMDYLAYPIDAKLQISSSTSWPPNEERFDSVFYNLDQPAGGPFTGDTLIATNTITNMSSTTNLTAGMIVTGAGVPTGTTVVSVDGPTQITISQNATASGLGVTFTFYKNKFLENSVEFQNNKFRVRASFTKASSPNAETVTLTLTNPISGFMLEETQVIRRQATSGNLSYTLTTIADSASIGEGYTLSLTASDAVTVQITDVTTFSYAKERA